MFFNLLTGETPAPENTGNPYGMYITLGIVVILFIIMFIFNSRSQKKKQEEMEKTLNAIKPGNKVKTIGGICGVVVEVCPEEGTFVLETGGEAGKSYIKFDRQAVYQTDATAAPAAEAPVEEAAAEEVAEAPVEEAAAEEAVEAPVEEAAAEEVAEAPVEEAAAEEVVEAPVEEAATEE
jgi:preprotein translocase YajC subunit